MILEPSFENEGVFLNYLLQNFDISVSNPQTNLSDLRGMLEKFLFQKGVTENKTICLIIDEAQKLSEISLEILRVFLNYETNEYKLLQLVLLGQLELHTKIMNMLNFFDRISFKYTLNPLNFDETKEMIEFRIRQAGYKANMYLFLDEAIREIYQYTRGYPRQITMLCYKALKALVMKKKVVVDAELIEEIIQEELRTGWQRKDLLLQKGSY